MARTLALTSVALFTVAVFFAGCGGSDASRDAIQASAEWTPPESAPGPILTRPKNTQSISAREVVRLLDSAGLKTKEMGPGRLSLDDVSRFPNEPRSTMVLRVSDSRGNSTPMTFVEFGSWRDAAEVDAKPINGFAVRNWFVLGTVSTHATRQVTEALGG